MTAPRTPLVINAVDFVNTGCIYIGKTAHNGREITRFEWGETPGSGAMIKTICVYTGDVLESEYIFANVEGVHYDEPTP